MSIARGPGVLGGLLVFVIAVAFGYLHVGDRCDQLGKNINQLEKKRERLRRDIVNEEYKWSNLTSPENMERLLKKHNLAMTWPSNDSVVRLRRVEAYAQYVYNEPEVMHD